ncbi:MAG TPA: D-hexose-6-phosphate mutarotase [Polyangiaceae bacterium]|jgi:glucose-6-phosphate 1-epimerase|nr:D-hexose-6-phosphate mutarotase [Polyangiaceae bacterium]
MTGSNSRAFGELPGVERVVTHGLPSVRVASAHATGLVFLQGAHIAQWSPSGRDPVIWMSQKAVYQRGKALRGGIPICFPWFGAHAQDRDFPQHGFARTRDFEYHGARLDDAGQPELELSLTSDEATHAFFPHAFEARLRITFGDVLALAFSVTNLGTVPFDFEEALHSYFHVADVRQVAVLGLQGATYRDKVQGMAELIERAAQLQLSSETDRVYASSAACTILDPLGQRSIHIEKSSSDATVVWNPWSERAAQMPDFGADAWPGMLCVESANVGSSRVSLAPGDTHTLRVSVSVGTASPVTRENP